MIRRPFVPALACTLAFLVAAAAHAERSAADLLRGEVATILAIVKDDKLTPEARRAKLKIRIERNFDFESMGSSILTRHWADATPAQRERFIELLKRRLEDLYLGAIERHTTEVVRVGGERHRGGKVAVIVTIQRQDGSDIPLLFKLKPRGGSWVVYDANVEGLSLVAHFRDSLGAIAASQGMEGVLAHLESLTA